MTMTTIPESRKVPWPKQHDGARHWPQAGSGKTDANKAEMRAKAWRLRLQNWTQRAIAEELGVSQATAWRLLDEARKEIAVPYTEDERQEIDERLHLLAQGLWPKADNYRVAQTILKIEQFRAQLRGASVQTPLTDEDPLVRLFQNVVVEKNRRGAVQQPQTIKGEIEAAGAGHGPIGPDRYDAEGRPRSDDARIRPGCT
jgi:predicted DNA-binding protein (UPF0251 family)